MKFKEGDITVRNNSKPNAGFDSIKNVKYIEIYKIKKINTTYFYELYQGAFSHPILYPQYSFDELYDLEILMTRRKKIKKIIKNIK